MRETQPGDESGNFNFNVPTPEQHQRYEQFAHHVRYAAGVIGSEWGRDPASYRDAMVYPGYDRRRGNLTLSVYREGDDANTRMKLIASQDPRTALVTLTPELVGFEVHYLAQQLDSTAAWYFTAAIVLGEYYGRAGGTGV